MKKTKRMLAFIMTLVLVMGEFAGTGIKAEAGGNDTRTGVLGSVAINATITAPALGAETKAPRVSLAAYEDYGVYLSSDGWVKKNENGLWEEYTKSYFEAGTYCASARLSTESYRIADGHWGYYEIRKGMTYLNQGGKTWTMRGNVNDHYDTNSAGYAYFNSPEYEVKLPAGQHGITVTDDGNGTAEASKVAAAGGERITLTAKPDSGYILDRWEVVSGGVNVTGNEFVMGTQNVVIKAVFISKYAKGGEVSEVTAKGNYLNPKIGNTIGQPKISVESPLGKNVIISDVCWYKKDENGTFKKCSPSDKFEEGSYRLGAMVRTTAVDSDSFCYYYTLTNDVRLKVNDVTWTRRGDVKDLYESYGYGYVYFDGPEIEAADYLPLSGTIYYITPISVGTEISLAITGELLNAWNNNVPLYYTWQRADNEDGPWSDIPGFVNLKSTEAHKYTPANADIAKFIRVSVTAEGYLGNITSTPREVPRKANNDFPFYPMLETGEPYNYVKVTNAKANQEYILLDTNTAPDWDSDDVKRPDADGELIIPATENAVVYIYTRIKETDENEAGSITSCATIKTAENTYLSGLRFDVDKITMCENDVYELTVYPVPGNAKDWDTTQVTWNDSENVKIYKDPELSEEATAPTVNKTVYLQAGEADYLETISVEKQVGPSTTLRAGLNIQIADEDGYFPMDYLSFDPVTVRPGETAYIEYGTYPEKGKVEKDKISFEKKVDTDPDPDIEFTVLEDFVVKAQIPDDAADGVYFYAVKYDGAETYIPSTIRIIVSDSVIAVEDIQLSLEEYTAQPGDTLELNAYVMPADAGDGITWTVDDPAIASVNGDGVVQISEDAEDGDEIEVKAKAGNMFKTCKIRVHTPKYVFVTDSYAEESGTGRYMPGETVYISAGVSENKVFNGWKSDEIGVWFETGEDASFEMPETIVVVTAVWKDVYTVSFNMCGHGTEIADGKVVENELLDKPADPSASGYKFGGWYTDEAYTNAFDFSMPITGNMMLYAKWIRVYTVKFDMNGKEATNKPKNQTVSKNGFAKRPDTVPVAEGFTFTDWYADKECSTVFDFKAPIKKNTTIYAGWKENEPEKEPEKDPDQDETKEYTVSFNMLGHGAAIEAQKVKEGGTVTRPADPKAEGYDFLGWFKEETCANVYNFADPVTEDLMLYAKWELAECAMNPVPLITENTKELYLVKGQKFTMPDGTWISDQKKYVSINRKGLLKAVKVTEVGKPVTIKLLGTERSIKVYVTLPKFASKKVTMNAGEKNRSLSFSYDRHNAVMWSTSNPDVATVSQNGMVSGIAKGKAVISAFVNGKEYKCTVKVNEEPAIAVRTLHLNLKKSKTVKLKGISNSKLIWASENESMASVKNGKIKAYMQTGKTTVTATSTETGKVYKVLVTVEDPAVKTGQITGKGKNKYKVELNQAGDKTKIEFSYVEQPVTFKSKNGQVAYVDRDGNIVANKKGKTTVSAKINGSTVSISVKVNN